MKRIAFVLAVCFVLCPFAGQAVFSLTDRAGKRFFEKRLRLNIFSDTEMDFQLLRASVQTREEAAPPVKYFGLCEIEDEILPHGQRHFFPRPTC